MTPSIPTESTVRHALGLAGYSLKVTFASESRGRGKVRAWQFPRPAPPMRAWVPTNVRGRLDQVVIVPGSSQ